MEIRETVQEITVPKYVEVARPKPLPFAHIPDSELLGYGVPAAWVREVKAADEDTILVIATHLPAEAPIAGHKFSQRFLVTEWEQVVDAWQSIRHRSSSKICAGEFLEDLRTSC